MQDKIQNKETGTRNQNIYRQKFVNFYIELKLNFLRLYNSIIMGIKRRLDIIKQQLRVLKQRIYNLFKK